MSLVAQIGGKQYFIQKGQKLLVEKINNVKIGEKVDFPVLFNINDVNTKSIAVEILDQIKGKKIRVVRYRNKKNYHKVKGFRPHLTLIKVLENNKDLTSLNIKEKEIQNKVKKTSDLSLSTNKKEKNVKKPTKKTDLKLKKSKLDSTKETKKKTIKKLKVSKNIDK